MAVVVLRNVGSERNYCGDDGGQARAWPCMVSASTLTTPPRDDSSLAYPTPNSNCYTTHRHGARRYETTVSCLSLRLCADKSTDRREHRQQRVRGAG